METMDPSVVFGPIADLIADPTVEEIWINAPERIFIARAGKSHLINLVLTSESVKQLVDRALIWSSAGASVMRSNLGVINLQQISCDGYRISLTTSSNASLPFLLPFTGISKVRILASVGSVDERKTTSNYYGANIGGANQR